MEIELFRHRFDRCFARRHGSYFVELRGLWSVPRRCNWRSYSHPAVYL